MLLFYAMKNIYNFHIEVLQNSMICPEDELIVFKNLNDRFLMNIMCYYGEQFTLMSAISVLPFPKDYSYKMKICFLFWIKEMTNLKENRQFWKHVLFPVPRVSQNCTNLSNLRKVKSNHFESFRNSHHIIRCITPINIFQCKLIED